VLEGGEQSKGMENVSLCLKNKAVSPVSIIVSVLILIL
jgi:hypothetical protein